MVSPRSRATGKRGRAARTCSRARLASWRQAAASRPIGSGDLVEGRAENVVQQEGGALQRRQALQRHHQRQGDVVGLVLGGFNHGLGQPRADIGLAPPTRRLQLIERDARDDAPEIGFRRRDRPAIDLEPAQEGVLHSVLRVRDRAQHAVGDADQTRTQRVEARGCVLGLGRRHAALLPSTGCTARNPTWIRFQPLIVTISRVSATCSSLEKCALSA